MVIVFVFVVFTGTLIVAMPLLLLALSRAELLSFSLLVYCWCHCHFVTVVVVIIVVVFSHRCCHIIVVLFLLHFHGYCVSFLWSLLLYCHCHRCCHCLIFGVIVIFIVVLYVPVILTLCSYFNFILLFYIFHHISYNFRIVVVWYLISTAWPTYISVYISGGYFRKWSKSFVG